MLRVACNPAHTVSSAASLPAPSACIACVAAVASILHRIVCKIPVAPLPLYLPWLVARRDFSTVVVAKLVTKIKNQGDVDTLLDPSHRRVLRQALAIGLEFAFHKSVQVQGKPKR